MLVPEKIENPGSGERNASLAGMIVAVSKRKTVVGHVKRPVDFLQTVLGGSSRFDHDAVALRLQTMFFWVVHCYSQRVLCRVLHFLVFPRSQQLSETVTVASQTFLMVSRRTKVWYSRPARARVVYGSVLEIGFVRRDRAQSRWLQCRQC